MNEWGKERVIELYSLLSVGGEFANIFFMLVLRSGYSEILQKFYDLIKWRTDYQFRKH